MTSTEILTAEDVVNDLITSPAPIDERQSPSVVIDPYTGIASAPFSPEAIKVLMTDVSDDDVEIRPDGLIYLPEIKYRRILNHAFGPGAWSLLPVDITVSQSDNQMYYRGRLYVHGRFVSESIGEQQYFASNDRMSYATAAESAKSNCLMRTCKDLGCASSLWDPTFTRRWVAQYAVQVWCTNVGSGGDRGKKRMMWRKKSSPAIDQFPWKEEGGNGNGSEPTTTQPGSKQTSQHQLPASNPAGARPAAQAEPMPRGNGASSTGKSHQEMKQSIHDDPYGTGQPTQQQKTTESGPTITYPQVRRFAAIARSKERGEAEVWSEVEQLKLIQGFGYATVTEILRSDYDKVCTALTDADAHAMIREELAKGAS